MARPKSTGHTINSLSAVPYNPGWNSKLGRVILQNVSPSAIVTALRHGQPLNTSTSTPQASTSANHQSGQDSILSKVVRVSAPLWANSRSLTDSEMQKCQHLGCHFKHGEAQAKIRHYWKTHALTCMSDECLDEDVAGCRGSPHDLHIHLWRQHGIAIPVEAWQGFLDLGFYQLKQCPGLRDSFLKGIQNFENVKHAKPKAAHMPKATNGKNAAKAQQAHYGGSGSIHRGPGGPKHLLANTSGHMHHRPGHSVPISNSHPAIPTVFRNGHTSPPSRIARAFSISGR